MDVLFVTANFPYPPNSGATIRTYNLIKRLADRHRLHLVAYADPLRDAEKVAVFEEFCASVTAVPWRETKGTPYFYIQVLLNLLSSTPLAVSRFTNPVMANTIQRLIETKPVDLLCCDFVTLSLNLPPRNGLSTHLTAHNVESVLWQRYVEHEKNPLKVLYFYLQYRKMLHFERRMLGGFRHVTCVSQDDLERLLTLCPSPHYTVVPNGVDLQYFRPCPEQEVPYRLVFTGSMDWRPNQDAVRFFLHRIYPEIKKAEPRTSVVIAGREPPTDLKTMMTAYKDVLLVGTVPDMRPYLASAAVYIVPLRIGGGTRLKILEAMAMGRPVVSTSVGCEGLAVAPGCDLLVADQPEAFAQAVLRLFRDPALADQVGRAGHDLVKKEYGWEQIANGLDAAWQAAAFAGGNRLCAGSPVY